MEKAMSFNDAAIVSVKRNDDRIHFWYMSNAEVKTVFKKNADLREKSGTL